MVIDISPLSPKSGVFAYSMPSSISRLRIRLRLYAIAFSTFCVCVRCYTPYVFCLTFGGADHWGDTSFKGLKTIK